MPKPIPKLNLLQGRNRDADVGNRHVGLGGGDGESGMNWETRIDMYTLPCVKQIASENLLHSIGSSVRCSVMTSAGKVGREGSSRGRGYMCACS